MGRLGVRRLDESMLRGTCSPGELDMARRDTVASRSVSRFLAPPPAESVAADRPELEAISDRIEARRRGADAMWVTRSTLGLMAALLAGRARRQERRAAAQLREQKAPPGTATPRDAADQWQFQRCQPRTSYTNLLHIRRAGPDRPTPGPDVLWRLMGQATLPLWMSQGQHR